MYTLFIRRFDPVTGHYTQLVWAESSLLGCGQITYDQDRFVNQFVVCNYGPAGNVIGSPIYTEGSACSLCPDGTTCSIEFPGLCSQLTKFN